MSLEILLLVRLGQCFIVTKVYFTVKETIQIAESWHSPEMQCFFTWPYRDIKISKCPYMGQFLQEGENGCFVSYFFQKVECLCDLT